MAEPSSFRETIAIDLIALVPLGGIFPSFIHGSIAKFRLRRRPRAGSERKRPGIYETGH